MRIAEEAIVIVQREVQVAEGHAQSGRVEEEAAARLLAEAKAAVGRASTAEGKVAAKAAEKAAAQAVADARKQAKAARARAGAAAKELKSSKQASVATRRKVERATSRLRAHSSKLIDKAAKRRSLELGKHEKTVAKARAVAQKAQKALAKAAAQLVA